MLLTICIVDFEHVLICWSGFFSKEAFVTCNTMKESKYSSFTIIEMSVSYKRSGTVRDCLQIVKVKFGHGAFFVFFTFSPELIMPSKQLPVQSQQ